MIIFIWFHYNHTREKGKLPEGKGKRERGRPRFEAKFHSTTRPRARTNETKRNDFPVGLIPPTSDIRHRASGTLWRAVFRSSVVPPDLLKKKGCLKSLKWLKSTPFSRAGKLRSGNCAPVCVSPQSRGPRVILPCPHITGLLTESAPWTPPGRTLKSTKKHP